MRRSAPIVLCALALFAAPTATRADANAGPRPLPEAPSRLQTPHASATLAQDVQETAQTRRTAANQKRRAHPNCAMRKISRGALKAMLLIGERPRGGR